MYPTLFDPCSIQEEYKKSVILYHPGKGLIVAISMCVVIEVATGMGGDMTWIGAGCWW